MADRVEVREGCLFVVVLGIIHTYLVIKVRPSPQRIALRWGLSYFTMSPSSCRLPGAQRVCEHVRGELHFELGEVNDDGFWKVD